MKKLNLLLTVLTLSVIMFATSCKSENNSSSGNSITGEWTITKAEGTAASSNKGMIYIFNNDGSLVAKYGTIETQYTYSTNNDTLTMYYNGGNDIVLTWTYNIDGNKMTMQNTSDDSQKFELEK